MPARRLLAQDDQIARERSDYIAWLETAPNSPFAAVAQQPIGRDLRLGPADADVPLEGVVEHRLTANGGRIALEGPDGTRPVPRALPLRLGRYTLVVDGPASGPVLTVFRNGGASARNHRVEYYPVDRSMVFTGRLLETEAPRKVRILGADGIEVEAIEAGSVSLPLGERPVRLQVRRLPMGGDESELEIFFRDSTNGSETYPAGRFVALVPTPDGRYRLDFNLARNPFCAYSTAYPCPAPWEGNKVPMPIRAGERYRP